MVCCFGGGGQGQSQNSKIENALKEGALNKSKEIKLLLLGNVSFLKITFLL